MSFVISPQFSLNKYDINKWLYNSAIFLAPVGIVFLGELVKIVPENWQYGAFALYLLNVLTDIVKRFVTANTYNK